MATEKKRPRRAKRSGGNPRSYSGIYKGSANQTVEPQSVEVAQPELGSKRNQPIDWKREYAYVLKDLRLLSIVSVVLFAGIVAARFFI